MQKFPKKYFFYCFTSNFKKVDTFDPTPTDIRVKNIPSESKSICIFVWVGSCMYSGITLLLILTSKEKRTKEIKVRIFKGTLLDSLRISFVSLHQNKSTIKGCTGCHGKGPNNSGLFANTHTPKGKLKHKQSVPCTV